MVIRSNRPINGVPVCVAILISALAGCGSSHPPNGAGKDSPASGSEGGGGAASPVPDDSASCARPILPAPDLDPQPVRPCTEDAWFGPTEFRYDATGRVVYRAQHYSYGGPRTVNTVYVSQDDGDTRIETVTTDGALTERHVTQMKNGVPLEADHYTVSSDGAQHLSGHSTWKYDASGRQVSVILDSVGAAQMTETDSYDDKGRLYFVDLTQRWPPSDIVVARNWTLRSWHQNGQLAGELRGCGDPATAKTTHAPCDVGTWKEKRWDACGNLTYSADETMTGRFSRWTDWSWDGGVPRARHDRWNGVAQQWSSTESYTLDSKSRAASSTIVIYNPSELPYLPPTEEHRGSYVYDSNGHAIQRTMDGQITFEALFDAAGRVLMRDGHDGTGRFQWTYDGCGG